MTEPLALVVSTADLTWNPARRSFAGRLSTIDPTFWVFHQAHYRGFGLRSEKTGTVLRFFIDRSRGAGPDRYTLRPTAEALDTCPELAGVWIELADDTDRAARTQRGGHRQAALLAATRERAARRAGDLTAAQAYAATAAVLARHAACPGL